MSMDFIRKRPHAKALSAVAMLLAFATGAVAQTVPAGSPQVHLSFDNAIQLALQHNHSLLAARATIDESRAEEITANLRPNPILSWDAQFLPLFSPSAFSSQYIENSAQFDIGVSYLVERGKKRQHRLEAARDQTSTTAASVLDNERAIAANVS